MGTEPWHVPILVMAVITLIELLVLAARRRWRDYLVPQRLRTAALAVLAILVLGVGVAALGPDLADKISSVAALVVGVVTLMLTYRSYQARIETPPDSAGSQQQASDLDESR